MALYNAQVELTMASGVTADYVTNTWHFDIGFGGSDPLIDVLLDASDGLNQFYLDIQNRLTAAIATTGNTITWYRMSDPKPRIPVLTYSMSTFTSLTGGTLPPELCLCLSSRAAPEAGIIASSLRNRVYIGPFASGGTILNVTDGRPTSLLLEDIADAADALLDFTTTTDGTVEWVIHSPTLGIERPITTVWVDNEWDIQRRRGRESTDRETRFA